MATSHEYTFGIEEEFFLTNPRTRGAVGRVPRSLFRSCKRRFGERVEHEMMQSQIETSTPICRDPDEARDWLAKLRHGIGEACDEHDLTFLAAGTHPLGEWREQRHTATERYERLIDDFQLVGRRNLLCGLHVHVEAPPTSDRVDVMNRLMHWLPVFLALSASSPFWNRQRTGLLSYRQAAYDEWPRTGIPDFFEGEAGYEAFVATLVAAGSIRDASQLWWAIRPALKFPTIELRIADSCTRIDDAVALAMLYRCLVRATVVNPSLGLNRTTHTRRLIDENRWRAKRYGHDNGWIDVETGREGTFGEALERLLELVAEHAHALGCTRDLERVRVILERGSSAHAQLAIYRGLRDTGGLRVTALRAVVDWLVATTRAGAEASAAPTMG